MSDATATIKYGVKWFLTRPLAVYRAGQNTHPVVGAAGLVVSLPVAIAFAFTVGLVGSMVGYFQATK